MRDMMTEFLGPLAAIVGGLLALIFGGFTAASFMVDCDAKIERWEAQEVECEERGGHWRARPEEMFCDGSLMLEPRGECWGDLSRANCGSCTIGAWRPTATASGARRRSGM